MLKSFTARQTPTNNELCHPLCVGLVTHTRRRPHAGDSKLASRHLWKPGQGHRCRLINKWRGVSSRWSAVYISLNARMVRLFRLCRNRVPRPFGPRWNKTTAKIVAKSTNRSGTCVFFLCVTKSARLANSATAGAWTMCTEGESNLSSAQTFFF